MGQKHKHREFGAGRALGVQGRWRPGLAQTLGKAALEGPQAAQGGYWRFGKKSQGMETGER